ncbi:GNAT family N-acetyltransferase [Streptomyces sp. NPDC006684]|uniref:GNAT family N-acetyltransferase n=1 Tax=Streptomyces sp. NPDC006684 TaxID=3154477 RepID=UPI003453AAD0
MPRLERLTAAHASAVLEFERAEREWFARWVPDRGDAYFTAEGFAARHAALLAEQDAGACRFHVLLDDDARTVLGRFNLMDVVTGEDGELGYRLARGATGRGLATAAVRELCALAPAHRSACPACGRTRTSATPRPVPSSRARASAPACPSTGRGNRHCGTSACCDAPVRARRPAPYSSCRPAASRPCGLTPCRLVPCGAAGS